MYYVARTIVASLPTAVDPEKEQHEQARVKAAANLRRIDRLRGDSDSDDESERGGRSTRRPRKEDLELDQYENQIAMELVAPEDIPVGFEGAFSTRRYRIRLTRHRYRWPGRYHRRTQRISHIPVDYASSILALITSPGGSVGRLAIWSTRVRQNDARKGVGAREWSMLHQSTYFDFDRKVVRRFKQTCSRRVLFSSETTAQYRLH